ncbi:MAG: hypothetical protein HY731_15090 [Candidatus Tectomicrobia bacterium]|nr:hypothetical protein [Candidatus Tectomicrobia bacterium]
MSIESFRLIRQHREIVAEAGWEGDGGGLANWDPVCVASPYAVRGLRGECRRLGRLGWDAPARDRAPVARYARCREEMA